MPRLPLGTKKTPRPSPCLGLIRECLSSSLLFPQSESNWNSSWICSPEGAGPGILRHSWCKEEAPTPQDDPKGAQTWNSGGQEWKKGHRNPMARIGSCPDLQTADPISWDEKPRLFLHLLKSRMLPTHQVQEEIPALLQTQTLQEQLFHGKQNLAPAPGTAPRAGSSSQAAPAFPCLSQPGCVGKVAQNVLLVPPQPPPAPAQGPQSSFGDKDTATQRGGNTYIGSGYLLLFPKGKHRGEKDRRLIQEQPCSQHSQKTNPGSFCGPWKPDMKTLFLPVVERKTQM